MTIQECLSYFKEQSMLCRAMEICGFLGEKGGEYSCKIVKNKHQNPKEYFSIDPMESLRFSRSHNMVAVFHSHIVGDCSPSSFDKVNSDNTLYPFLIYSLAQEKFGLYEPPDHKCNVIELRGNL